METHWRSSCLPAPAVAPGGNVVQALKCECGIWDIIPRVLYLKKMPFGHGNSIRSAMPSLSPPRYTGGNAGRAWKLLYPPMDKVRVRLVVFEGKCRSGMEMLPSHRRVSH